MVAFTHDGIIYVTNSALLVGFRYYALLETRSDRMQRTHVCVPTDILWCSS